MELPALKKTGDDVLDYIVWTMTMRGEDPATMKEVQVAPMPVKLRDRIEGRMAMKACYHNTWTALHALRGAKRDDARYVLGYWHHIIPIEHCFLKIGDTYHDPTGECLFSDTENRRYFTLVELTLAEVKEVAAYMKRFRFRDHIGYFEHKRWLMDTTK